MRKFKIINANGAEFDLNDLKSFLTDPTNLGYSDDSEYEQVGLSFYESESAISQPVPSGTINFASYEEYLKFIKFIQKEPLKLEYTAADTFYMKCKLANLTKTEIHAGRLSVGIQLIGLTQWYKEVKEKTGEDANIGKYYPYKYSYTYSDKAQGEVVIQSDSALKSPAKITILGPCKNPTWIHYVNGVKMTEGRVIATIPKGNRLVISSEYPYSIKEYDEYNIEVKDRYQDSDFETERFVYLGIGENKLSIIHEGDEEINATVEGMVLYVSV